MKQQNSLKPARSLLERAAQVYDFEAELNRRSEQPAITAETATESQAAPRAPEPRSAPADIEPKRHPAAPLRRAAIDRARLREHSLIEPGGPSSGLAEEFRILKRQLLLGTSEQSAIAEAKRQTILVCSAQPDDGKTFCAVNLALSIASEEDVDVLLIDGDFANPGIPDLFGIPGDRGLADALADPKCDPNEFVIQTDIGGFSILPAGKKANNITELLASARTSQVLRALTEHEPRRVLIFDSPPALVASPACVLASHAGQIMMVVRADHTTETDLREALSLLSACQNISLMLNRADRAVSGRRFGTYYGQGE